MDKHQRVEAALRRQAVDRVPLSLWRHYHRQDRTPGGLARVTVALARTYDLDLVKLTPSCLYAVEDWAGDRIVYPGTDRDPPYLSEPAVALPEQWRRLPPLDPRAGALGRELEAIRLVAADLGGHTPLLMTVFSPLTLAYKLAGPDVVVHLREHPEDLHAGLEIIARTTIDFARAALDAGANGLFFATQLATHRWLAPAEYGEFGGRYDRAVLDAVAGRSSITVLHLHGRDIFFELANRYPVDAVSWHDHETDPPLAGAQSLTGRAFLAGLDRELLEHGPVSAIRAQVAKALAQTKGRGLIVAPSCVIPTGVPDAHLQAVRDAIPTA